MQNFREFALPEYHGDRIIRVCLAQRTGDQKREILLAQHGKPVRNSHALTQRFNAANKSVRKRLFALFAKPCGACKFRKRLCDGGAVFPQNRGQQNGICKASMLPLYPFSLELLSEAYALKKGKQMRAELDRGALFSCQADVVKRICNTGPNLITIPDKWLLDLDTERDDSSDELLLSPNATFLSQQSGM